MSVITFDGFCSKFSITFSEIGFKVIGFSRKTLSFLSISSHTILIFSWFRANNFNKDKNKALPRQKLESSMIRKGDGKIKSILLKTKCHDLLCQLVQLSMHKKHRPRIMNDLKSGAIRR
uniref:Uncharacterized protein n=1 Tax=Romanomermis culicivorax TaxID=13658 RepID=A0A915IXL0_ROMCU